MLETWIFEPIKFGFQNLQCKCMEVIVDFISHYGANIYIYIERERERERERDSICYKTTLLPSYQVM